MRIYRSRSTSRMLFEELDRVLYETPRRGSTSRRTAQGASRTGFTDKTPCPNFGSALGTGLTAGARPRRFRLPSARKLQLGVPALRAVWRAARA